MNNSISSYRDLIVWQRSMELVKEVYKTTASFPTAEVFGLSSQMRRASVSIPSNIAEGKARGTRKEYRKFLQNAYGSGAELETQIEIAKALSFSKKVNYEKIDTSLDEVMRMLNALIKKLS